MTQGPHLIVDWNRKAWLRPLCDVQGEWVHGDGKESPWKLRCHLKYYRRTCISDARLYCGPGISVPSKSFNAIKKVRWYLWSIGSCVGNFVEYLLQSERELEALLSVGLYLLKVIVKLEINISNVQIKNLHGIAPRYGWHPQQHSWAGEMCRKILSVR